MNDKCLHCGEGYTPSTNGISKFCNNKCRYKFNKNKNKYKSNDFIIKWAKKIRSLEYLGGKCRICGDKNIFHLTFHHIESKDKRHTLSQSMDMRWSSLKEELDKCLILCCNCHRHIHFKEKSEKFLFTTTRRQAKSIYLEYMGGKCKNCGYDKCQSALTFHHLFEKKFNIGDIGVRIKSIKSIYENGYIKCELDKCILLCANCHNKLHVNMDKFEKLKNLIYLKREKCYESKEKVDINQVIEMYKSGISRKKISKILGRSNSTISCIVKDYHSSEFDDLNLKT